MNIFKNTFKILAAKFSLVWAMLLYYLIAGILIVSVGLSILLPYINGFLDFKVTETALDMLKQLSGGDVSAFFSSAQSLWRDLAGGFNLHVWTSYLLFAAVLAIARFLFGLADLAFYDLIHEHMSSAAHLGFTPRFVKRIGSAALYQLGKLALSLPVDFAILAVLRLVALLAGVPVFVVFVPFLMMLSFILLSALRINLFGGWAPALLEYQKRVGVSFGLSVKAAKGTFGRNYVVYLLFFIAAIVFNLFFGLFTLLVGLILTLPLTLFFLKILNCVMFRQNAGLRYYVDKDVVVNN